MRTSGGRFAVSVLLQMPAAMASRDAQAAFVGKKSAVIALRVPNAAGHVKTAKDGGLPPFVDVAVAANAPRDGDFVFNFATEQKQGPASARAPADPGQARWRRRRWSFSILVNGQEVAIIPEKRVLKPAESPGLQAGLRGRRSVCLRERRSSRSVAFDREGLTPPEIGRD